LTESPRNYYASIRCDAAALQSFQTVRNLNNSITSNII
jgi:hypothetical protein